MPLLALALGGCGLSGNDASDLARAGHIDRTAPIQASNALIVAARPERVWALLTAIDRWPTWRPDIEAARLDGPARSGTRFTWTSAGTQIDSRLAQVQPFTRLTWTGRAMGLTASHCWTLQALGNGRTLVRTDESMTGFPASLFYSSRDLAAANARWLVQLKDAAEKPDRP